MLMETQHHIPECVGVIIDGNRRWAREHNVPVVEGHRTGYENLKSFVFWARDAGVKHVIAYVFSTENWNRSTEEVDNLMKLVRFVLNHEVDEMKKEGVHVSIAGERERFDDGMQKLLEKAERETVGGDRIHLVLALSYGGRAEILSAVQQLVQKGDVDITEEQFSKTLWTCGIPDPDMIIRTGGEKRLSNFLLWQAAYSELFFTDTLWPAFTKEEFLEILQEFSKRERRHGR